MNKSVKPLLYWAPRVLTLLFAIFISLFALDVFGEGYSFWETLVALFMHLVPAFLVLIALAVAWRWEWVGAVLFFGLGVLYIVVMRRDIDWVSFLLISGPLFVVGALFLANWMRRAPSGPATGSNQTL